MLRKGKVLIGIVLAMLICLIAFQIVINHKTKFDDPTTENEKKFEKYFYDSKIVSKGEIVDIKYIYSSENSEKDPLLLTGFEIVKKYDFDFKDLEVTLYWDGGEEGKKALVDNMHWNIVAGERYYLDQFVAIFPASSTKIEKLIDDGKLDIRDMKLQVRYKDKVEVHELIFDENKVLNDYEHFFKTSKTEKMDEDFTTYFLDKYSNYNKINKEDYDGWRRVSLDINDAVVSKNVTFGVRNNIITYLYNVFGEKNIHNEKDNEIYLAVLKEILYSNRDNINSENQKKFTDPLQTLKDINKYFQKTMMVPNKKIALTKKIEEFSSQGLLGETITEDEFWQFIDFAFSE